jgi:hypothetical protein
MQAEKQARAGCGTKNEERNDQIRSPPQQGKNVTAPANRETPPGGTPIQTRGLSVQRGLAYTILGAIAAIVLTIFVLRNTYSTGIEALLAAFALAAFGLAAYGLLQTVLAIVDTAGERRRQDREVSERRKGERARQPRA